MTRILAAYVATLLALCVLDLIWIGGIAKGFYQAQIGPLLLPRPSLSIAALLYLVYAAGITGFVTLPALAAGSPAQAVMVGALFGLVVYSTYDLTNLATLKGWTVAVTIVDALWGAALTACAAGAAYATSRLAERLG